MPHRLARPALLILVATLSLIAAIGPGRTPARSQQNTPTPEVYAEAIGQANLRSGPGLDYPVVGEITQGTRYRVLARHSLVPWLEISLPELPDTPAWVYQDLVSVTGDLGAVPAVSDFTTLATASPTPEAALTALATPTATPTASPTAPSAAPLSTPLDAPTGAPTATSPGAAPGPTLTPLPSETPALVGPIATTLGEANVRFGPDVSYPVIVKVPAGASYRVIELHALYPWVHIALTESPTGSGWIYRDVVDISGDLSNTPVTSATQFTYPTLTPTPDAIVVDTAPWGASPPAGRLATSLGQEMLDYLLAQGFAPYGEQTASVFVMDLKSGDTFTLNDGVAYSGMSLTKIPILVTYFLQHSGSLSYDDAYTLAEMMMCSENISTNDVLALLGDGDALTGAQRVTDMLQTLGLTSTFILRQYLTVPDTTPVPGLITLTTEADQTTAQPDAYNQVLPKELGFLLASIYQCAQTQSGLLIERFPNQFDAQECRKMLYAMDADTINVFLEAGVPLGTRVMHKHGWIGDTHGDAGIAIGPDASFVFVAVLYARDWLEFDQSEPVIEELARMTWNALNPSEPVAATHPGTVPGTCDPASNAVISQLMSSTLPALTN